MKATLSIVTLTFLLLAAPAYAAGYIKEGAVACLSLKNIKTYLEATENNVESLAQDLLDRADCFQKKKPVQAMHLEDSTAFSSVKTYDGFTVWLKKEDFITDVSE